MKKILVITGGIMLAAGIMTGCKSKNNPGLTYMPDMAYSRAYETYAGFDTSAFTTERTSWGSNEKSKIFYSMQPVAGTIARGDMAPYALKNDTSGYAQSASIKNPLTPESLAMEFKEAERLYLVNCGICHGSKLDGNGPLWKGGDGPFTAAPKNLMGDDMKALGEGTIFHVLTYGKGQMGSYASQLSSKQRWMVAGYVKKMQAGSGTATKDSTKAPAVDSTAVATKM